jgi:hypothetical protein
MTLAPPHLFDSHTALEAAGEGRWRAGAPEPAWPPAPSNGGFEGSGPFTIHVRRPLPGAGHGARG